MFRLRESHDSLVFEEGSADRWHRLPVDGTAVAEGLNLKLRPNQSHTISPTDALVYLSDGLDLAIREEVRYAVDREQLTIAIRHAQAQIDSARRASA